MRLALVVLSLLAAMAFAACDQIPQPGDEEPAAASRFEVGNTVRLTTESGVCLQTYAQPGFDQDQLACLDDGTVGQVTDGPAEVEDEASGEAFTWWQVDGAGWLPENWIQQ